ncbi:MAG TPA: rhomboid family intramembrane serine protease [Acidobacteria bacterium]|nr:rhomboid family intramembrane serine protease [Acidobacteriota bacterium]
MRREQWHLTEALIFAHFAFYFLTSTSPDIRQAMVFYPQTVMARPWSVLTFQFLHGGMIGFFFSMLILWIMGRPLEDDWGSPRFLIFWLVSVLGAVATAFVLGQPLAGDIFYQTSLLFTFATVAPDVELLLFFVLPVKVKWLAILGGGFLLYSSFTTFGPMVGIANAAGMSAGYVFFLATRKLPSRHKMAFKVKQAKEKAVEVAKETVILRRNQAWDPKVREAVARAAAGEPATPDDEALLAELDAARDSSVTICAPEEFHFAEDPVCGPCPGYPECATRAIRMARETKESS